MSLTYHTNSKVKFKTNIINAESPSFHTECFCPKKKKIKSVSFKSNEAEFVKACLYICTHDKHP